MKLFYFFLIKSCGRTVSLLDEAAVGVDASAVVLLLGLLLAQPQDVLQAVQSHLDNLRVHHRQQVTQRLDAAQVHQISARKKGEAGRRGRGGFSFGGACGAAVRRDGCVCASGDGAKR